MIKTCSKCKTKKYIINFHKNKTTKDGYNFWCKNCRKEYDKHNYIAKRQKYHKKYYQKNKKRASKNRKKRYLKTKKRENKLAREYYYNHRKHLLIQAKKYTKNHKINKRIYDRKYKTKRRQIDINYKLRGNLSSRVRNALKYNIKSGRTLKLLGCSIPELKQYLQNQFKKGMSWKNHGKWEIDHIIPCAKFDLSKAREQRKCFHYTNLQPLWAEENRKKKDNV